MKVIRTIVAAAVILVIGAVVLIVALPGEKIAKLAADQVKAQTGRDLTFGGAVGISWYPVLGVSAEDVSFGNAAWSDLGPMFAARKAVIGVDVMAALGGNIRIKNIELVAPDVLLERGKNGQANWDLSEATTATQAPESGAAPEATSYEDFALDRLVLSDARVRYIEHGGARQEISGLSLQMRWPGRGQTADISLQAAPFGTDMDVAASVVAPLVLLQGGVSDVSATLSAAGGQASFDGRVGIAPEASGRVHLDAPDGAAFLAALGAGGVEGPLKVGGEVTLTRDARLTLRGGEVEALGNVLAVQADVDLSGVRPRVTAQIATDALTLGTTDSAQVSETEGASVGWSEDPIDASALGLVDGTITFAAETMQLGGLEIGRTRATVEIDRARAVATLSEMAAYEGTVAGTFVANNRNGLSVRGDLSVTQVALQPLLQATAGLGRFTGKADFESRFLSSGQSLDALMKQLSGDGAMQVGRGTIAGIDLDRLLRGDVTGGTTVFDNMSASWTITDGVLRNDDLAMGLPRMAATGKGTVGIGQQTIDYLFTPQLRGADGASLIVPVKVRGSWSNPSIVPDLDAAIKGSFDKEIKAVEDEAVKALEKELGLQKEEGQSSEDALKKKLEEEATKGLLKLLGGN
ncbi:AsmA family protein [Shimia sp.]|uniref:AsmA family protein n=1 Tax=Shimia sp. TaxID=1954381 RepID=UPI003B8CD240